MGMPATAAKEWTVEMLEALPDDGNRYEIIDGELFVSPGPAWRHQRAVTEMLFLMKVYLKLHRIGLVLTAPADVDFDRRNVVEPDIFVTPLVGGREPSAFNEVGSLLLAIEILSPSTARLDRTRKRDLYRCFRVPEYWIVDVDSRLIERWRPNDERPEMLEGIIEWQPPVECGPLQIDLPAFFAVIHGESTVD